MRRALRDHGPAVVSMAGISSALVLIGRVWTVMLSIEAKVFALSLLWVALLLLQRVLVGKRRTSGHWLVQYTAWAAYYLPAPVAFSAASALYYYTSQFNESLLTGILCMLLVTPASRMGLTNMRAYSLHDRPRGGYSFLVWLVLLVFLAWTRIPSPNLSVAAYTGLSFMMALFVLFPIITSESTLDCQTKAVADCMKQLKSKSSASSSPFFDNDGANSHSSLQMLDCCSFPVVQGRDGKWVTVKDLFHECGDLPTRDKDICLSYSLCQLLARRYYGFPCTEEGDDLVRRFVLADLGRRAGGYRRAFKIVEVQLAFLHDYFFTCSLPIIEKSGFQDTDVVISLLVLVEVILFLPAATLVPMRAQVVMIILVAGLPGMHMLWCVLFGTPMSLLVKILLASYWRPIHTAFRKINCVSEAPRRPATRGLIRDLLFRASPNPNAQEVLIDPFQTHTDDAYWRNKIGQYSILQDYDRRHSPKKALEDWFNRFILSQPSYWFIKHLPVEEEEVDMLGMDNMRELVANTLRDIDGPPTNGTRSLKINMHKINKDDISRGSAGHGWWWTCKQQTHTETILIWNIATLYCDDITPISADPLVKRHHEAARTLSRYCAYLVAFLPEFLPEHSLTTKQVFQRVLQEAQSALGTEPMKEEEKRIKIQGLQLPDQHEQWTTFHKGVHLGRQLEMLSDEGLRWKVMAEFWAETILYIAPSDNVEAHIEQLAKGGEFITHLWAMLSNAGILKRAEGEWHPPGSTTNLKEPPKKMETTKARTQECPF